MRGLADGHAADLRTLPEDGEQPAVQVAVGDPQPDALADPQTGAVEHLEHGEVASGERTGDAVVALAGQRCDLCDCVVEERGSVVAIGGPGAAGRRPSACGAPGPDRS